MSVRFDHLVSQFVDHGLPVTFSFDIGDVVSFAVRIFIHKRLAEVK